MGARLKRAVLREPSAHHLLLRRSNSEPSASPLPLFSRSPLPLTVPFRLPKCLLMIPGNNLQFSYEPLNSVFKLFDYGKRHSLAKSCPSVRVINSKHPFIIEKLKYICKKDSKLDTIQLDSTKWRFEKFAEIVRVRCSWSPLKTALFDDLDVSQHYFDSFLKLKNVIVKHVVLVGAKDFFKNFSELSSIARLSWYAEKNNRYLHYEWFDAFEKHVFEKVELVNLEHNYIIRTKSLFNTKILRIQNKKISTFFIGMESYYMVKYYKYYTENLVQISIDLDCVESFQVVCKILFDSNCEIGSFYEATFNNPKFSSWTLWDWLLVKFGAEKRSLDGKICATIPHDDFEFNVTYEGLAPLPRRITRGFIVHRKWRFKVMKMAKGSSDEPIGAQWSNELDAADRHLLNSVGERRIENVE